MTHCRRGHKMTAANSYKRPRGVECRQCRRLKKVERTARTPKKRDPDDVTKREAVGISYGKSTSAKIDWDVPSLEVRPRVLMDCVLQNGARYRRFASPMEAK